MIEGVGSFELHGVGCRFQMDSGEEVDFDWDERGHAVFDWWRIRAYARSVGAGEPEQAGVVAACRALADRGLLFETSNEWFTIQSRLDEAT